jgi:hypothetical protein
LSRACLGKSSSAFTHERSHESENEGRFSHLALPAVGGGGRDYKQIIGNLVDKRREEVVPAPFNIGMMTSYLPDSNWVITPS